MTGATRETETSGVACAPSPHRRSFQPPCPLSLTLATSPVDRVTGLMSRVRSYLTVPAFAPGNYPRVFSTSNPAGTLPATDAAPLYLAASMAATSSIQPQKLFGSPASTLREPVIGSDPTSTASFR